MLGVWGVLVLALGWPTPSALAHDESLYAASAMVAADHPLASQLGVDVLQAGGNAADAMVTVSLALGVVNPFSSGLGGGGFALWRDATTGEVVVLDYREIAPAATHRDIYLVDGEPEGQLSRNGGLAVAVPTEAIGLYTFHERFGRLPWRDVVEPARALAADGFPAGSLLAMRLDQDTRVEQSPELFDLFRNPDGTFVTEGDLVTRPRLATALAILQEEGPEPFMRGAVAEDIVDAVSRSGGVMTMSDFDVYTPIWRQPVEISYRGYTIYGMPLPSSGGLVTSHVLQFLANFELSRLTYDDAMTVHTIAQAFAHAFADRARWMGDDAFVDVDVDALIGPDRVERSVATFDPVRTLPAEMYGAPYTTPDDDGTSHFSIIDADGNAVACTTTINTIFGSRVVTETYGIILNNEMDDFAIAPGVPNAFGLIGSEANAVEPHKRPLSSMSPTIVTRDNELIGALGASGGPIIISATILTLVRLIDFNASAWDAVNGPRFHHMWTPPPLFVDEESPESWLNHVEDFGYPLTIRTFGSAVQVVWRAPDGGWMAASDRRKHGAPAGY